MRPRGGMSESCVWTTETCPPRREALATNARLGGRRRGPRIHRAAISLLNLQRGCGLALALALALLLSPAMARRWLRPVNELVDAWRRVAGGDALTRRLPFAATTDSQTSPAFSTKWQRDSPPHDRGRRGWQTSPPISERPSPPCARRSRRCWAGLVADRASTRSLGDCGQRGTSDRTGSRSARTSGCSRPSPRPRDTDFGSALDTLSNV